MVIQQDVVLFSIDNKQDRGFSLIELLVVVAIVGILAAIAIPQFAAYRQRSCDAASLSDLRNLKAGMESYNSDKQIYPLFASTVMLSGATITALDGVLLFSLSQNVQGTIQSTGDSFAALTLHQSGSRVYGAAADSSKVFMNDIGVNTAIAAADSSVFAGWGAL